jgi:transcriptional regulator with XRE-family HTH domain
MTVKIDLPEGKEGFGERLRFLLFKNHTTITRLAEQLGITGNMMQRYASNLSRPSLENCLKICKILGCSIEFLVLGKEE